jgi:hypothetical protein
VITTVTAVDYSSLRFKDAPWVEPIPRLDRCATRSPSVRLTRRRCPTSE